MTRTDDELRRRSTSPRIVLWLGPGFQMDAHPELRKDLARLPLIATFTESTSTVFEQALVDIRRLDARHPVAVTTTDTLEALLPGQLPIYYLSGAAGDRFRSPKLRRVHRDTLVSELSAIAEERPLYVALGVDGIEQVVDLMTDIGIYDADGPLMLLGTTDDCLAAALRRCGEDKEQIYVEPVASVAGWNELLQWCKGRQVDLLLEDAGATVRVGQIDVPLASIFADPSMKIDDRVRIVTTRALHAPPQEPRPALFEAFMAPDERARSKGALDDLAEWWAIDVGIPLVRPELQSRVNAVLGALEKGVPDGHGPAPICWLPTEPGAGATSMLHQIAHAVAKRGHPTLVVKQLADEVSARSISDFLVALREGARTVRQSAGDQDAIQTEVPALLVLDVPHSGTEGLEEVPERLTRSERRTVVTLWALNVEPGKVDVPAGQAKHDWYRRYATAQAVRKPLSSDVFLTPLRGELAVDELDALEQHARRLREKRGIGSIELKDRSTWQRFQRNASFHGRDVIADKEDSGTADDWLLAESLFWPGLFHFLTNRALVDPYQNYRQELHEVALTHGALGVTLLLQIAKCSVMGLPLPDTALRDFLRTHLPRADSAAPATSTPPVGSGNEASRLASYVEALREHWTGRSRLPELTALDEHQQVRRLVVDFERRNLVRSLVLNGSAWLRISHRSVARALLDAACGPDSDLSELGLTQDLAECDLVLGQRRAYAGISRLLQSLDLTTTNVRFCELLSLMQLQGGDEGTHGEWASGEGEGRLEVYRKHLPATILQASRALLHHFGNVLRRSTRASTLSEDEQRRRLHEAEKLLMRALDQPWISGRKDEHPGHLLTTLGLIQLHSSRLKGTQLAERQRLEALGRATLEEALTQVPDSRHTRLSLAENLVLAAERSAQSNDVGRRAEAAGLVARIMQLLEVSPTGVQQRWYETKKRAAGLFHHEEGMRFLQHLQERGIEDGYLLVAEICLSYDKPDIVGAIEWLRPLTDGARAGKNLRSVRRLAELYGRSDGHCLDFRTRHRLLSVLESSGISTTPDEEYQLAYLEYQLGRYAKGASRFAALRVGQRQKQVDLQQAMFLTDRGDVRIFNAQVKQSDGRRGRMDLFDLASRTKLFDTEYFGQQFDSLRLGATIEVAVRFSHSGTQAVPARLYRR